MSEKSPRGGCEGYGARTDAMTRTERRQARRRRAVCQACAVGAVLALIVCAAILTGGGEAEEQEAVPTPEAITTTETTPSEQDREAIDPLEADKTALAKMVWGEARGCSTTEQAAVVWCALNRFDSGDPYYANCMTIYDIVTQPGQFCGYDPGNPVDADILALVEDVMVRWMAERYCIGDVGRVLPAEYLYFTGDGRENTFRDQYQGGNTWDWSMDSPYGD